MTHRPRIGAMFGADRSIAELPDAARELELLGYDELWVVEDCFAYGGLTAAATALAVTQRITVGVGLLPAAVRNPAITAMELTTLANLHPDRLRVALGHGVEAWMRQINARPADRLVALREVAGAVLGLLRGDTLTVAGRVVQLDGVKLEQPPAAVPPILLGTTGKRGIALAGEITDGLVVPEGASEAAVGAIAAMLSRGTDLTVYAWMRVDDDPDAARDHVLPELGRWRDGRLYPMLLGHSRLPEDGPVTREDVSGLALVPPAQECAGAIARLHQAGATAVVVVPVGPDPSDQLERFAADVLSHVPSATP
jgi:alkanesulfonate monooxygenase SsuD/methylene tetrahydromethanopterin reductase-like flavin-dependent oxidoreductase (luciferase family)